MGFSVGAMPLSVGDCRKHSPANFSRVALSSIFLIFSIWQLVSLTSGILLSQPTNSTTMRLVKEHHFFHRARSPLADQF